MPLSKGKSRAAMSANYKRLRKEGRPKKQALAIMLRKAGKARKRRKKR